MTRARGVADYGYYPPVNNNILINPSFTVNQRGSSVTLANSGYTLDRWKVAGKSSIGGNGPVTVMQDVNIPYVRMKVINQGTPTAHSFALQMIETVNLFGAFGKEMTLSFGYSSSTSTLPVVSIGQYNASGAVTWLATDAVVTPYGSNKFKYTFTLPDLSTTDTPDLNDVGLQVRITANEGNTAPAEWYLWETKLEVGSVATPSVARSYGEELALCERYFQLYPEKTTVTGTCYNSELDWYFPFVFPEMRTSPTVTFSGNPLIFCKNINSDTTSVTSSTNNDNRKSIRLQAQAAAVGSAGSSGWFQLIDANSYFSLDAEL